MNDYELISTIITRYEPLTLTIIWTKMTEYERNNDCTTWRTMTMTIYMINDIYMSHYD